MAVVGAAVVALGLVAAPGRGAPPLQDGSPAAVPVGTTTGPAWAFVVHLVQDPYPGVIVYPEELPAGTRGVAAEVEVVNGSDQPLAFDPYQIRLRDSAGVSYQAGDVFGGESDLEGRNLEGGELARGWVWFAVPAEARPIELVLIPQAPEFRVPLTRTG